MKKVSKPQKRRAEGSQRTRNGAGVSRALIKEADEIVLAIRRGKIDALVMGGEEGDRILKLQGPDQSYRILVETINDGVATLDADGVILYANSRFASILRTPLANFIGTSLLSHVSAAHGEELQRLIGEGISDSTQGEITLESEGRLRLVRLALTPVKNSKPQTVCVVATELTELAEANEAIRANEESLRQLSARLLKLQDEERRHIARDLHDVTGQKLAVQSISLSQVLNRKNSLDEDSRRILMECAALNKQVGEEIRTLSYLLHPPLLDELGLASAVKWYAEGFERRTGIVVKVEIGSELKRLPPDVEVTLFRIVQESLTNVHRYSGSPKAFVRVNVTPEQMVKVQIGDFGKGMPRHTVGKTAPLGVGIQGMKERMRQLGGKLEITSAPSQGALVIATLPVTQPQAVSESGQSGVEHAGKNASASARGVSRKQILLADDHEMMRRGLRTMLEKEAEWEICGEAVDGRDVVEKAASLQPDLVILDINMPVLNGLAAVRQILRVSPQSKILVFTVHNSEQTCKEIQTAGAHGYLSKSNASEDLLRVVRELLNSPAAAFVAGSAVASDIPTPA